jgi:hypothetical protein
MTDQNPIQLKKDNALRDQVALLSFVEDLIKERKDPNINEKNIANVRALLLKEVNEAINTHLISLLTEKDQIELDVLLEKKMTNEELDDFFHKKIPNLEVEIASALLNFRAAYLYPLASQTSAEKPARLNTLDNDRTSQVNQKASSLPPAPPVAPTPVKN